MEEKEKEILLEKVRNLIEIGSALTTETNLQRLLDKILTSASRFTSADGGTIYTVTAHKTLQFAVTSSDSLQFHLGATAKVPFPEIPLFLPSGASNDSAIVAYAANWGKTVNIKDAYYETGFDFTGPRLFDQQRGYRTKSVLALPMKNHEGEVLGILQLINAYDPATKKIIAFSADDVYLAEALASQAGVALTNQRLVQDLKTLFESFVRTIAKAIDEKSPHTGNHSRRIPILCEYLADAVNATDFGPLAKVSFTDKEIYELKLAAFLHDCGKIATPVHVVEKHTRLETVYDRIETLAARFEVLKRDADIKRLTKKLEWYENQFPTGKEISVEPFREYDSEYEKEIASRNAEMQFLERCNKAEFVTDEMAAEIKKIASLMWKYKEALTLLLTSDEVENLCVSKGNLNEKERKIIENHVVVTKNMLSEIPFPKDMRRVPDIAANHHERLDGKGYPAGKKKDELSLQARILMISDIFEALSAPDRPYKEPLPLSRIYKILEEKVAEGHLDPDLVDVFLKQKVGLRYAKEHLAPKQIDVD